MLLQLGENKAKMNAARFFEQYHNNVVVKEAVLEGDVWQVTVSIGLMDKKIRRIRIHDHSGEILEYW